MHTNLLSIPQNFIPNCCLLKFSYTLYLSSSAYVYYLPELWCLCTFVEWNAFYFPGEHPAWCTVLINQSTNGLSEMFQSCFWTINTATFPLKVANDLWAAFDQRLIWGTPWFIWHRSCYGCSASSFWHAEVWSTSRLRSRFVTVLRHVTFVTFLCTVSCWRAGLLRARKHVCRNSVTALKNPSCWNCYTRWVSAL